MNAQAFQCWRRQRPFWGSILVILAGILVLWGPFSLSTFFFFVQTIFLEAFLVGAFLILMGFLQLVSPSLSLITGAVSIVLALTSVLVAFGGMGIGVFLGLIGGALSIAWRPGKKRQAVVADKSEALSTQENQALSLIRQETDRDQ